MTETGNIPLVNPKRTRQRPRSPANAPGCKTEAYNKRAFAGTASRLILGHAGLALVLANVRYWSTVAPLVGRELTRWERTSGAIPDPTLRALASGKLRDEHFNAQVAATLATLAPGSHRPAATEAIVALQVMYDYLDVLSEQPVADPLPGARHLFAAFLDALSLDEQPGEDYHRYYAQSDDGGYLQALVDTVRGALAILPATGSILEVAQRSATRCAEAQILNHQASRSGIEEPRRWATLQASGTGLGWQEYLAGATASVLGIHALIAAAADEHTTRQDAEQLDALYLSIGAVTMLDSLVDLQEDIAAGQLGYVQYYDSPELMATRLQSVARDAVARARGLHNGLHHIVTLVGVAAYYTSAPTANSEFAWSLTAQLRRELRPLITPTLALMRAWRLAKRVRR